MSFNDITPEQRQAALDKAKETRAARAKIRSGLKSGRMTPAKAMDRVNDPVIGRIEVSTFIRSIPGFGAVKAENVMADLGIMENRRLAGLGTRQRESLWNGCNRPLRTSRPGRLFSYTRNLRCQRQMPSASAKRILPSPTALPQDAPFSPCSRPCISSGAFD